MRLCIVILLTVASVFASEYKLTLLHTNDVHSRIDEAHKYGGVCSSSHSAAGDCVGGAARLATKIKEINSTSDNLLLLDGGDQFQGTFWFFVYEGMAEALVMEELGYDAMAIGNHEFDLGLEVFQQFIHNVSDSFDVLSANIDNVDEPGLVGYKPFVIREVGGRRIGIIGYTTVDTPDLTAVGGTGKLVFVDVVTRLTETVAAVKAADPTVNIIIAVGHAGFSVDLEVAQQVDGVDIVVGGHTNTFLYNGTNLPSSEKPSGTYPYRVTKNNGKVALCVQAYTFSKYLGHLDIMFDDNGDITGWSGNPILLDNSVAKDSDMEALLAPLKAHIDSKGNETVARSAVKLNSNCRVAECNFGNIVCDAWIHSNIMFGTDIKWARAAIALSNSGSIRADINKGSISYRSLKTSMPFGNDVVTVTVSGDTLKKVFERSAEAHTSANNGGFLQVSGVQILYDLSQPIGQRVIDMKLRCLDCEVPKYEPLDLSANYTVLTTSFLALGGDGYDVLVTGRLDFENLGYSDSAMVVEYMTALNKVYPTEEGRIKFVSGQPQQTTPVPTQTSTPGSTPTRLDSSSGPTSPVSTSTTDSSATSVTTAFSTTILTTFISYALFT